MVNGNRHIEDKVQEVVSGVTTTQMDVCTPVIKKWVATETVSKAADGCHASITALATVQTITDGITQPTTTRNVTITTAKGGGTNMSGNVVVTGTNIWGQVITDTLAEGADGLVAGTKAFKTVTSILVPVRIQEGDAITVGYGDSLGVDCFLPNTSCCIKQTKDGTADTLPTVSVDADEIEKNMILCATALNAQVMIAYFLI